MRTLTAVSRECWEGDHVLCNQYRKIEWLRCSTHAVVDRWRPVGIAKQVMFVASNNDSILLVGGLEHDFFGFWLSIYWEE